MTMAKKKIAFDEENSIKMAQSNATIKTHSSAIQMTHKLTLTQHKAWLVLLRQAYKDLGDPEVTTHKIRLSELSVYLGYTSNRNDAYFKNLLKELVDAKVSWNIFNKEGDEEWGVASLLAGCKVKKGMVEYDYSAFLREKLYNPRMFALLNLKMLNQFRSKYALAIYNLCKDYLGVNQTPTMELAKFREFVGLEPHEYSDFKSMNRRVIKEPVEEINKLSDLMVASEYIKEGRKVSALKFHIKSNPQMKLDINSITNHVMQSVDQHKTSSDDDMLEQLSSFGIKPLQAKKLMAEHDRKYLVENMKVVEEAVLSGSVKNVASYTIAAFKNDYRPKLTFLDDKAKEKIISAKKVAKARQEQESARRLREKFEQYVIEKALSSLNKKAAKKLENEFLNAQYENKNFVMEFYREKGFQSIVVQSAFYAFAKGRILPTDALSDDNYEKYLRQRRKDH